MNGKIGRGKMLRLASVTVWPSFLVAILAEGFFFSVFDPSDLLHLGGDVDLHLPSIAIYTLGFFFFWGFCALASMLTYYLSHVPDDPEPPF